MQNRFFKIFPVNRAISPQGKTRPIVILFLKLHQYMGTTTSTHFGIPFPANYPLSPEARQKLARIFIFNPSISLEQIKWILGSPSQWADAGLISEAYFICTPDSERTRENYEKQFINSLVGMVYKASCAVHIEGDVYRAKFLERFKEWLIEFSFPRLHELDIITSFTGIESYIIMDHICAVLSTASIPESKIPEFILMYETRLSPALMDKLLELYISKHALNQSDTLTKSGNKQ